jgi:hypothetical protein
VSRTAFFHFGLAVFKKNSCQQTNRKFVSTTKKQLQLARRKKKKEIENSYLIGYKTNFDSSLPKKVQ